MPKHKIDSDPEVPRIKVSFNAFMTEAQYEQFEKAVEEIGLFVAKSEKIEHVKLELIKDKADPNQLAIPGAEPPKKRGRQRADFATLH
jgi:hypothetical protein